MIEDLQLCTEEKQKNKRKDRENIPVCDEVTPKAKVETIRYLVKKSEKNTVKEKMSKAYEILTDLSEGLLTAGLCVLDVILETRTRLLVGASEGPLRGVFEVGLTFDPVLDLPIIPGSSLKGAMRFAAKEHCINSAMRQEECDTLVNELFGHSFREGSAVSELLFFDSYPVVIAEKDYTGSFNALILPDIVTPHYYRGGGPVKRELDATPVPVQHVSISEGVPFRFVIGVRANGIGALERYGKATGLGGSWSIVLLTLLMLTLRVWGVGSRTTKGYGLFDLPSSEIAKIVGLQIGCKP